MSSWFEPPDRHANDGLVYDEHWHSHGGPPINLCQDCGEDASLLGEVLCEWCTQLLGRYGGEAA